MGKTNTINEEYMRWEDLNQELIVLYVHINPHYMKEGS